MAGRAAELSKGVRITDHISLGVVAKTFPVERVNAVLEATGKQSQRRRDLPVTRTNPQQTPTGPTSTSCRLRLGQLGA